MEFTPMPASPPGITRLVITRPDGNIEIIPVLNYFEFDAYVADLHARRITIPQKKEKKYYQCQHGAVHYASVMDAARKTGLHRYHVKRNCDLEIDGWKWNKKIG